MLPNMEGLEPFLGNCWIRSMSQKVNPQHRESTKKKMLRAHTQTDIQFIRSKPSLVIKARRTLPFPNWSPHIMCIWEKAVLLRNLITPVSKCGGTEPSWYCMWLKMALKSKNRTFSILNDKKSKIKIKLK